VPPGAFFAPLGDCTAGAGAPPTASASSAGASCSSASSTGDGPLSRPDDDSSSTARDGFGRARGSLCPGSDSASGTPGAGRAPPQRVTSSAHKRAVQIVGFVLTVSLPSYGPS